MANQNKNFMHRFIVTAPDTLFDEESLMFTSNKESDAKDWMYGNSDNRNPIHMRLWDMRQEGENGMPLMIDELNG